MRFSTSIAFAFMLLGAAKTVASEDSPSTHPAPSPSSTARASRAGPPGVSVPTDDASLLKAMRDSYVALIGERARAQKMLQELGAARYDEGLGVLARKDGTDRRSRAEALRKRLVASWTREVGALGRPGQVDSRLACRAQERMLRQSGQAPAGSQAAARLPAAREEASTCYARLSASLEALRAANAELAPAVAEARTLLAAAQADAASERK
jgi:hypothetical protein